MLEFPKKFEFVSCRAIVELQDSLVVVPARKSMLSKKVVKELPKPKSASYKYVHVPQGKLEQPSKKMGSVVEYTMDYLNRLENFQLIRIL